MAYTGADVQNILTAFAEEFSVDIKAQHTFSGDYLIEFNDLNTALVLGEPSWYQAIADYANESTEFVAAWEDSPFAKELEARYVANHLANHLGE